MVSQATPFEMKDIKCHAIVCTAIFGNYDDLQVPTVIGRLPYYCIYDDPIFPFPEPWIPLHYEGEQQSVRWKSIECKLLAHRIFPEVDVILWVDGNIKIHCRPKEFLEEWLGTCDIAVLAHTERRCVYKEAKEILRIGRATPSRQAVLDHVEFLKEEGYPEDNGLAEVPVLLRRHVPSTIRFNEAWYRQTQEHSSRTQMSFNYLSWKLGIPWWPIQLPWTDKWHLAGGNFDRTRHRKKGP